MMWQIWRRMVVVLVACSCVMVTACISATTAPHVPSVYVATSDGTIRALRQSDGVVLWHQQFAPKQSGDAVVLDEQGIVDGEVILRGIETYHSATPMFAIFMAALDATTGALQWRNDTLDALPSTIYPCAALLPISGPGLCVREGQIVMLHSTGSATYVAEVDPRTGAVQDRIPFTALRTAFWSLGEHMVFGGSAITIGAANATQMLTAWDIAIGKIAWQHTFPDTSILDPIVVGDVVLANAGTQMEALRATDGAVLWRDAKDASNQQVEVGSAILTGMQLVKSSGSPGRYTPNGFLVMARDALTGTVRWQQTLGMQAQLVGVIGATVVVDTFGHLIGIDVASGKALWNTPETILNVTDAIRTYQASQTTTDFVVVDGASALVFDAATGHMQTLPPMGLAFGGQVAASGTLVFGYDRTDGTVRAGDTRAGTMLWQQQFSPGSGTGINVRTVLADS